MSQDFRKERYTKVVDHTGLPHVGEFTIQQVGIVGLYVVGDGQAVLPAGAVGNEPRRLVWPFRGNIRLER